MHLDDSACNLASLNLMKFVDDEDGFLVEDFQQAVDVTITAMDIIVTRSGYPTEAIGANARAFRQLGTRLRQPGRAAHVQRHAVRLGRRAVRTPVPSRR